MNSRTKAITNLVLTLLMFAVNALGATGFINGMSQKDVSDKYMTLITPSPRTFSIWGVIYTLLLILLIVMIFKSDDDYYQELIETLTPYFMLSCIVNAGWIIAFSFEKLMLSVLFILILLLTIILATQKLLAIQEPNRWLAPVTFGIYGAWLFVATLVNVAASLMQIGWNRFGLPDTFWTIIILVFAIIVMVFLTRTLKNAAFPLVWIWALFGIFSQLKTTTGLGAQSQILFLILIAGMLISAIMSIYQFSHNKFQVIPTE